MFLRKNIKNIKYYLYILNEHRLLGKLLIYIYLNKS